MTNPRTQIAPSWNDLPKNLQEFKSGEDYMAMPEAERGSWFWFMTSSLKEVDAELEKSQASLERHIASLEERA